MSSSHVFIAGLPVPLVCPRVSLCNRSWSALGAARFSLALCRGAAALEPHSACWRSLPARSSCSTGQYRPLGACSPLYCRPPALAGRCEGRVRPCPVRPEDAPAATCAAECAGALLSLLRTAVSRSAARCAPQLRAWQRACSPERFSTPGAGVRGAARSAGTQALFRQKSLALSAVARYATAFAVRVRRDSEARGGQRGSAACDAVALASKPV
ncbi:hypothetical protein ERJ75_000515800 [Trypanosoma vivax]|nr:hypothetical protein TRVL_06401 [Trypanosoma vivax]KAH8616083.1 hypothetical protein ERJ75_000515800 [Trypanosoma vivax]